MGYKFETCVKDLAYYLFLALKHTKLGKVVQAAGVR